MKWLLTLIVSVGMFFAGYYHAARYESDEPETPTSGEEENTNDTES